MMTVADSRAPSAPTPVTAAEASVPSTGYRRLYRVTAAPGSCLVQRVRVRIQFRRSGVRVADYQQSYYEFFAFDADAPADAHLFDLHDFDLLRCGWRQTVIFELLRRHRAPHAPPATGEAELLVHKQFTLAPGQVRGAEPSQLGLGTAFGFCASGPSGASRTTLRIARGDGSWATRDDLRTCPAGYPVAGHANFTTAAGWRALEVFRYRFTTLCGNLAGSDCYRSHRIA